RCCRDWRYRGPGPAASSDTSPAWASAAWAALLLLTSLAAPLVAVAARTAAATRPGRGRGLRVRRLLGQVVPVVHPHLDADIPLRGGRLGKPLPPLAPRGGRGDAPRLRLPAPGLSRPAEPAGELELDPLGPGVHALFHRLLHGPPEAGPLLKLL